MDTTRPLPADPRDVASLADWVGDVVELTSATGIPPGRLDALCAAVREGVANALEHGRDGDEDDPGSVRVVVADHRVLVRVTDRGPGVTAEAFAAVPEAAAKLRGDEPERGWGLFLMQALVDEVHSWRDAAGHHLDLVLRTSPSSSGRIPRESPMHPSPQQAPSSSSTVANFLAIARTAVEAIRAAADRWEHDSALRGYTVGGLAGHLARGVTTVQTYLEGPPPEHPSIVDASGYFAVVLADEDAVGSELHRRIRERGVELAAQGPEQLAGHLAGVLDRLASALRDDEELHRPLAVRDGIAIRLEDYLRTRLVELVVHLDDLAASGVVVGAVPSEAVVTTAEVLGGLAGRRHGTAAVRSLARAERHPDPVRAM